MFNKYVDLSVRFVGETGIDHGGLTREFISLALNQLQDQNIFFEPDGKKDLGLYYQVSKMKFQLCFTMSIS